jgi:putative tryptophan/tyrosine transport system substrate-binding protein
MRTILAIAFLVAGFVTMPVFAQPPVKDFRVGHLSGGSRTPDGLPPRPLRDAMRELGYAEGRIRYEARFAEGRPDELRALAADLVRAKVDVIVAQGGPAAAAAKQATSTIPIVVAPWSGDAVATGLISSMARPGGNVTGLTDEVAQLSGKRVEMLREALPSASVIAVIWNANDPGMVLRYGGIEHAANALRFKVQSMGVRTPGDFPAVFATLKGRRPDAIILVTDTLTSTHRKQVIDFAATARIPALYEYGLHVRDGGLLAYGPSPEDAFRRAAVFIDRIFKGARPGQLPAEQPTRYYLTINLKVAAELGLTIPPTLLLRADEVIQ